MGHRVRPPEKPVSLRIDGDRIVANEGEPLAAALVGSGIVSIARSPKFHRPRGAACMRGGCDGCVVRVDGVPNVMGCLEPCREGMVVETQNRMGPRGFDLLRANDWFFPNGMNHHEVFIDVPGAEPFLRHFARRISGLGHLPDAPRAAIEGMRRPADIVVVGGGAAGLAAALAFVDRGRGVELLDENVSLDHVPALHAGDDEARAARLLTNARAAAAKGALFLRLRTKVAGVFGRLLLVEGPGGAEVLEPALTVLATGAHDGPALFEGNDLPGVYALRAARRLLAAGITPGKRVVLVVHGSAPAEALALAERTRDDLARAGTTSTLVRGEVLRVHGASRVRKVTVRSGDRDETLAADALVFETRRSPSFELAKQAGAPVTRVPGGFAPTLGAWGGCFAVIGEATGAPPSVDAFETAARSLAETPTQRSASGP